MQARCNFFWIQMAENSGQKKEIRHGAMVHVVLKCKMDDPSEIVYVHENLWDCKEYVNQQHIGSWEWYEIHQCLGKNKFGISLIKDYNDEDWEEI